MDRCLTVVFSSPLSLHPKDGHRHLDRVTHTKEGGYS